MPVYDFYCKKCRRSFEKEFAMAKVKNSSVKCPECNSGAERIYTFSIGRNKTSARACGGVCPYLNK